MTPLTDDELYRRNVSSLVASWEAIGGATPGATVVRGTGFCAAVFPTGPERAVYNNAVIDRHLDDLARQQALRALEAAYRQTSVEDYAVWAHERDPGTLDLLRVRGYVVSETTQAMGLAIDELIPPGVPRHARVASISWTEYRATLPEHGIPAGLFSGATPDGFRACAARQHDRIVSVGLAFDHDGDTGVFNVGTVEPARRQGLGAAVTHRLVGDGGAQGCTSATVQSSPMATGVYRSLGFRDLGRIVEHRPAR